MKKLLTILFCVIGSLNLQAFETQDVLINGFWYRVVPEYGVAEVVRQPQNSNVRISYTEAQGKVVIPDSIKYYFNVVTDSYVECAVVGIGPAAFFGNEKITEVVLPQNLKYIENMAFGGCKKLKSINLPPTLQSIYQCAFWECTALKSIVIPDSLRKIGGGAFEGCTRLEKIVWNAVHCELQPFVNEKANIFAEDNVYVPPFTSCDNVVDVTFGQNVAYIPLGAMAELKKIKFITIPQSVQEIGGSAFANCPKLKKVRFENSLGTSKPHDYWFSGTPADVESVLMPGESIHIY